jgi:biotin-dependent carboxylase-like uncharacterized protein
VIKILAVRGLATVQDRGRPGFMHEGVPPGGALVPELAARANEALGNALDDPLLEVFGGLTLSATGGRALVATEDGGVRDLAEDEPFELPPSRALRVRYLAVAGGLDVPRVLGGRGTLLAASVGGHDGRALVRGDRIAIGREGTLGRPRPRPGLDRAAAVRVVLGPDLTRFEPGAIDALLGGPFTVLPSSDRTGTRLEGPPLARRDRDGGRSAPMCRGAIQVPGSGEPIVLGPDHPTTGGYPVIGVVTRADLGCFFSRPVGSPVRFALATLDEARALVLG